MDKNIFLANTIYYFHLFIVLFVVIVPFTNIASLLVLHVAGAFCLLVHWKLNSNICSLTVLEAQLRGIDRVNTFTHELIAPIYDISNTEWSHLCSLLTIILLFVSLFKLINNEKIKELYTVCKQVYNTPHDSSYTKFINYIKCFSNIFN